MDGPAPFMMLAFYTYPTRGCSNYMLLFTNPTIAAVATVLMLATLTGLAVERDLRWRAARGGRLAVVLPPREAARAEPVSTAE